MEQTRHRPRTSARRQRPDPRIGRTWVLLALLLAAPAAAQQGMGIVEGQARSAELDQPLPFALVRILPVDSAAASPMGVITDANGRFRLAGVPAGDYRLQLDLIGYQRTLSPVLSVRPGTALHHSIVSQMEPVHLDGITVNAGGTCLDGAQLPDDPTLAGIWEEARKGMETRRAFERQYRFTRHLRQQVTYRRRFFGRGQLLEVDTLVNEPDSAIARAQRRQEQIAAEGYVDRGATGFVIRMPDEKELLDDRFLIDHCLESLVDTAGAAVGVRFRPIQPRRDRADIRGTVWLDAESFLIKLLEVEYVKGDDAIARSSAKYEDIRVGGSTVRLPVAGDASGRPSGLMGVAIPSVDLTFTIDYRDFRPVVSR